MKRPVKPIAFLFGASPLIKLAADAALGHLGANPISTVLNRFGFWALLLLTLSLSLTPLKIATGWSWPIAIRRMMGLYALLYVSLHLVMYLAVDQFFDWEAIGKDIAKRPFITVGVLSFFLLIPLGVTSTKGWTQRLGARNWKRLHRLAYAAAIGGIIHFVWRVKADLREPLVFASILAFGFIARIVAKVRAR